MELSAHIDWISATMRGVTFDGAGKTALEGIVKYALPIEMKDMKWISTKPVNGYANAMKSETGMIIMSHPERVDMGTHIVMSGATLANNSAFGVPPDMILKWIIDGCHRVSRIDYALDAKDSGLDIDSLAQQIRDKKHKSRVRSAPYINDGIRKGKTQYLGSMKNRTKLVRIYDKAIDLGDPDADWKRVEMELHGNHAVNSVNIINSDENGLERTIQALIKAFIDFPEDEVWSEIIGSDEIWLSVPEVQKGNTELWLLKQCAPALAKILDLNESFMHEFMVAVQENRE